MEFYLPLRVFRDEDYQDFSKLPHSSEWKLHCRSYKRDITVNRKRD
jgi:hypothetical protein